jgi:prophage DNA circulation protein
MRPVFEQYPIGSWQVPGGDVIEFAVVDITESGGQRIVPHRRPHRPGAKLESTGEKERTWNVTLLFNNSLTEGVVDGVPLYPQRLRQLLRSFKVPETGTLVLPTTGKVRARPDAYERRETSAERDTATLVCTWIEDNEESLERAALNPPSVVATLVKLAEQTEFTAQRQGLHTPELISLTEFASQVEGLLLAPGRAVSDLGSVIKAHRRAIQRMVDAATTAANDTGGLFSEPKGSETQRQLRILLDRESLAENERTSARPRPKSFVIDVEVTSLYEVAARVGQPVDELMDLNSARIADPFYLTRGQVILIFESAPQ